jgi:hypothetical protein
MRLSISLDAATASSDPDDAARPAQERRAASLGRGAQLKKALAMLRSLVVSALAYLPFRLVYVPTVGLGRVVRWLAEGYRTAPRLERLLIFPSWAVLRAVFMVGCLFAQLLHTAARRSLEH